MEAARSAAEADGVTASKFAHKKRKISTPVTTPLAPSIPGLAPSIPGLAPSIPGLAPSIPGLAPSIQVPGSDVLSINRDVRANESDAHAVIETPSAGTSAHLLAGSSVINKIPSTAADAGVKKDIIKPKAPPIKGESGQSCSSNNTHDPSNDSGRRRAPLRRGKWTPEEEAYANRLILEFKAGLLPLTDGTTLRTFLSKLLNCDPMRISKKFVGSNCIGKQVFRRRALDVNRLTPDQIQKSRKELSELEMKFLDRVAQNKAKAGAGGRSSVMKQEPSGEGIGMGMTGMNKSAAAAGRALLQTKPNTKVKAENVTNDSVGLLAQLQQSQPGMFDGASAGSFLTTGPGQQQVLQTNQPQVAANAAMAQVARNASAARMSGLDATGNSSMNNLMLQTGMSREQISQLAQAKGLSSSASLANMLGKQRSFDGLMSLDFQSMQSIDNLANLIQAGLPNQAPKGGMKNWDWGNSAISNTNTPLTNTGVSGNSNSGRNLAGAAPVKSEENTSLENLVRSLSGNSGQANNNSQHTAQSGQTNATFGNLLQSMQGNAAAPNVGFNNLLQSIQGNGANVGGANMNYGNLLQGMQGNHAAPGTNNIEALIQNIQNNTANASNNSINTDFSTLQQMQAGRNGNVNDVLSLMGGSGEMNQQNFNHLMFNDAFNGLQQGGQSNQMAAALAQQQLLTQQTPGGNQSMANFFAQQSSLAGLGGMNGNFGNIGGNLSAAHLGGNLGGPNLGGNQNTAALLQQLIAQQNGGVSNTLGNNSAAMSFSQIKQEPYLVKGALNVGKQTAWGDQNLKRNFADMNGGNPPDGGVTKKASL